MRQTTYTIIGCLAIALCWSCEGLKEQTLDPFYIALDSIEVRTTLEQGAATHKIRDAWVLTEDRELGPFELPVTLPVIPESATTEFSIFPGIRNNGQEGLPIIYPFIKPHIFTVSDTPGEIYQEPLLFEYYDNVVFEFIEDFEGNQVFTINSDEFAESELTVIEDEEDPSNHVARVYVNENNPICEVLTASNFVPSNFSERTYLEIDYKSEVPLVLGIQKNIFGNLQNEYIIILKTSDVYNKLYLEMSRYLSDPDIGQFSLIINVDMAGLNLTEAEVFIDNIKLLHL